MPTTQLLDQLTASAARPVALAYGRHIVAGNQVFRHDDPETGDIFLHVMLGEGEWDSVEQLWLNGKDVTADVDAWNFHPGLDGVGPITAPYTGTDGDQKVDELFPETIEHPTEGPIAVEPLTYSRTAYLAFKAPEDVEDPTDEQEVLGIYKCLKVNVYDANGVQIARTWSANGALIVQDLLLRAGLPLAALDLSTFVQAATDITTAGFETHIAITAQTSLSDALTAALNTFRGYLYTTGDGRTALAVDQARAAVHSFSDKLPGSNIAKDTFDAYTTELAGKTNRLTVKYRDLANDFAIVSHQVDREWAQDLYGVIPAELDLGNSTQEQARRIGEYLLTRAVDDRRMVRLTGFQDSIHLLPGDRVDVEHELAPWQGLKAFEVIEVEDQTDETREFLLKEYDEAAFFGDEIAGQTLGGPIVTALAPPSQPLDYDVTAAGDGLAVLTNIQFAGITPNDRLITHGILALFHWPETQPPTTTLAAPLGAADLTATFTNDAAVPQFAIVVIDAELIFVSDEPSGGARTIVRAQKATAAAAHAAGADVLHTHFTVSTKGFPPNAFVPGGNGASEVDKIPMFSQLVVAASLKMRNRRGEGVALDLAYTAEPAGGLRCGNGRTISLFAPGALVTGVQNVVPPGETVDRAMSFLDLFAEVEEAVTTETVIRFRVNGTAIGTVTIPAGQKKSNILDGQPLGWIEKGQLFTMDHVSGTGGKHLRGTARL